MPHINHFFRDFDFFFAAFFFGTCGVGGVDSIRFMTSRASRSVSAGTRFCSSSSVPMRVSGLRKRRSMRVKGTRFQISMRVCTVRSFQAGLTFVKYIIATDDVAAKFRCPDPAKLKCPLWFL